MKGFTDELRAPGEESDEAGREQVRREITFGMDMEIFMQSDVGKFLSRRAAAEIRELRKAFDTVEPTDAKKIAELQNAIAVRGMWREWIEGAIAEGTAAQMSAIDRNVI